MGTSPIKPDKCNVFITIFVDVDALVLGSTTGCYAVDNQGNNIVPSTGEGGTSLTTAVASGVSVCWQIMPIDPQYINSKGNTNLAFTAITAPSGWSNTPMPTSIVGDVWTGQVSKSTVSGPLLSAVTFNCFVNNTTVTLPLVINVISA